MLVIKRKVNQQIVIGRPPHEVTITIVRLERGAVRLGIDAPLDVLVDRSEVRVQRLGKEAGHV